MSRYLITAALPYANGPVHIGHLAGCYIPADIYARYLRLKGEDVKFIYGSDDILLPSKHVSWVCRHRMWWISTIPSCAMLFQFGISFDHYSALLHLSITAQLLNF